MTVKEVEERTGIARSSIRFYEKEKLIQPVRNESNGYRDYTEEEVRNIKKIAYLRTLEIPLEKIHCLIHQEVEMRSVLEEQENVLDGRIAELQKAKLLCQKMLEAEELTYENLNVEEYVPQLTDYWRANRKRLKRDSVDFLYLWGDTLTWGVITGICLLLAGLSYPHLPQRIPVQWNSGEVSSEAGKLFIFAYPAACLVIRFLLRPALWGWLKRNISGSIAVTNYAANYLCFLALSAELFTVLYVYGIARHITVILLADTVVLIGLLLIGFKKKRII